MGRTWTGLRLGEGKGSGRGGADGKGTGEGNPVKGPGFPKAAGVSPPVEGAQLQSGAHAACPPPTRAAEAQTEQRAVAPPRPSVLPQWGGSSSTRDEV